MGATPQAGLDFSDLGAKSIAPVATPQSGGMDFSDLGGKSITASQSAPLTEQDAASGSFANQQARTQTAQEIPPPKETLESMVDSPEIQKMRLLKNPKRGDRVKGVSGVRKARTADPSRQKGKRGGFRYIYIYFVQDEQIGLLYLFDKNEKEDLSKEDKKLLAELASEGG